MRGRGQAEGREELGLHEAVEGAEQERGGLLTLNRITLVAESRVHCSGKGWKQEIIEHCDNPDDRTVA